MFNFFLIQFIDRSHLNSNNDNRLSATIIMMLINNIDGGKESKRIDTDGSKDKELTLMAARNGMILIAVVAVKLD